MVEIWKPVLGFEDSYQVSNRGNVRSIPRTRTSHLGAVMHYSGLPLKKQKDRNGYFLVTLSRGRGQRKRVHVHTLVLEAFEGPRSKGMECCHGPRGKECNEIENLKWGTHAENMRDKVRDGTCRNQYS